MDGCAVVHRDPDLRRILSRLDGDRSEAHAVSIACASPEAEEA
jgi:hypothetical protein